MTTCPTQSGCQSHLIIVLVDTCIPDVSSQCLFNFVLVFSGPQFVCLFNRTKVGQYFVGEVVKIK